MRRRFFIASTIAGLAGCGGGEEPEEQPQDAELPQGVGAALDKQRFDGVLRQPHRASDLWFEAAQAPAVTGTIYDFRPQLPPVGDEGKFNSCVGFAEGVQVAMLYPALMPSAMFIWNNARIIENSLTQNVGVYPGDAMQSIADAGECNEAKCPYSALRWNKKPSAQAYVDAKHYRVPTNLRLAKLEDMVACVASGFPFTFTTSVYNELLGAQVYATGIVPMPNLSGISHGLHRFAVVGMDLANSYFLIRSSWGTSWAKGGYAWMPFAWIGNTKLAVDSMTLRRSA